jgi:hypothetical protein
MDSQVQCTRVGRHCLIDHLHCSSAALPPRPSGWNCRARSRIAVKPLNCDDDRRVIRITLMRPDLDDDPHTFDILRDPNPHLGARWHRNALLPGRQSGPDGDRPDIASHTDFRGVAVRCTRRVRRGEDTRSRPAGKMWRSARCTSISRPRSTPAGVGAPALAELAREIVMRSPRDLKSRKLHNRAVLGSAVGTGSVTSYQHDPGLSRCTGRRSGSPSHPDG